MHIYYLHKKQYLDTLHISRRSKTQVFKIINLARFGLEEIFQYLFSLFFIKIIIFFWQDQLVVLEGLETRLIEKNITDYTLDLSHQTC